jgi:hypothetical protein
MGQKVRDDEWREIYGSLSNKQLIFKALAVLIDLQAPPTEKNNALIEELNWRTNNPEK